nr:immunoglobulin heavy chain junction region [Mus musculus]MBK4196500.1 immunoglobulin heavy chain junction region [Mus musculus]
CARYPAHYYGSSYFDYW